MRRTIGSCLVAALMLGLMVAPVTAAERHTVTIVATTTFDDVPDTFTAEGLGDCTAGVVENGPANVAFTRHHGVFAGFKVFDCGADTGFVLRLNARFGEGGSVGTWSVVDAWGDLAGMQGSGRLTGVPIDDENVEGIIDTYEGTVGS
jgi:hypothetical protein